MLLFFVLVVSTSVISAAFSSESGVDKIWFAQTRDARQAVAVDAQYVYAVSNQSISKIHRATKRVIKQWMREDRHSGTDKSGEASKLTKIKHLNSGVILSNRLYSAHSNWPELPAQNTIEVWDVDLMRHVESIDLAGSDTWITWVDQYRGHWWMVLAHYDAVTGVLGKQVSSASADGRNSASDQRTRLLQLDDNFKVLGTWYFPPELLAEFAPMSNSGGSWGPDGKLWLTGHDQPNAYIMSLPPTGSQLVWESTITLPDIEGQGIAWDRSANQPMLFGVRRTAKWLVAMDVTISE